MFDNAYDNLLVIGIMLGLFILIYCKMQNKTLSELTKEIKEMMTPVKNE